LAAVLSGRVGEPAGPLTRSAGRRHRNDHGMATAEYAVGTVGTACLACALIPLGADDWFRELIMVIIERITGWLTIGHLPMFRLP